MLIGFIVKGLFTGRLVSDNLSNSGKPKPIDWNGNPEPSLQDAGRCRDWTAGTLD